MVLPPRYVTNLPLSLRKNYLVKQGLKWFHWQLFLWASNWRDVICFIHQDHAGAWRRGCIRSDVINVRSAYSIPLRSKISDLFLLTVSQLIRGLSFNSVVIGSHFPENETDYGKTFNRIATPPVSGSHHKSNLNRSTQWLFQNGKLKEITPTRILRLTRDVWVGFKVIPSWVFTMEDPPPEQLYISDLSWYWLLLASTLTKKPSWFLKWAAVPGNSPRATRYTRLTRWCSLRFNLSGTALFPNPSWAMTFLLIQI